MSISNIFDLEPLISETWKKNIYFQNIQAFVFAKKCSDMLVRLQKNSPNSEDFSYRDIIFANKYPDEIENPNLFHFAKDHLSDMKFTVNSGIKFESASNECKKQKHYFWKKVLRTPPQTNEIQQSKDIVHEIARNYKLNSQIVFVGLGFLMAYGFKMYLNPLGFTLATTITGLLFGNLYGEFKHSEQIFQSIPKLPESNFEKERQNILNYCFAIDLNLISNTLTQEEELEEKFKKN